MQKQKNKRWQAVGPALALAAWNQGAEATPIDFNYSGASVQWTVPSTGLYHIFAFGAQGGNGNPNTGSCGNCVGSSSESPGGFGAKIGGDFNLSAGLVLDIAVGGQGHIANIPNKSYGGGGGGGGGYGGPGGGGGLAGISGLAGTGGGAGGAGGTNGQGGAGASDGGGGGGGFLGNGGAGGGGGGGGYGFATGLGGAGGFIAGGFGGGGGGGHYTFGGGGGGGYSGGGGGGFFSPGTGTFSFGGGGGGGSFLDSAALNPLLVGGFQSGDGLVQIEQISSAVPEPGSLALLAAGAAGFASRRRHRQG